MISKFKKTSRYAIQCAEGNLYIAPHELLKPYIAHYTVSFPESSSAQKTDLAPETLTIIPDASGCFVFTVRKNHMENSLWGPTTKTVIVKNNEEDCQMRFFIEFLPRGLSYFTGVSQNELVDLRLPIEQVNRALYLKILEAFESARDLDDFIEKINFILLPYIIEKKPIHTLEQAVQQLRLSCGTMSVRELSQKVNYSERHINRIFNEYIGMSAKTFSRLIRVNVSIQLMRRNSSILTTLAQQTGFYDQAHFIHDFKAVCGTTPKNYISNMSDFYNEILKY